VSVQTALDLHTPDVATIVSNGAIAKLVYGVNGRPPSRRVLTATAERLAAVTPAHIADGQTVPAEGTWKRIRQLLDAGFTKAEIGRHVHGPHAKTLQLSRKQVHAGNARAVAQLHARWAAGDLQPTGRLPRPSKEATDVA
jgi:hypothetical protein